MAKQKMGTGGDKPKSSNTMYSGDKIYTEEQKKDMRAKYAGNFRGMVAAQKEDIHGGKPEVKRYPYGSEGWKEAQKQSEANARQTAAENRAQDKKSAPGSQVNDMIKSENTPQPPKLIKYTGDSKAKQEAAKKKNEQEKKKGETDFNVVRQRGQ